MLILHGNSGKSQVVSILAGQTDSYVFVYANNPPIIDGCTILRRSNTKLAQLVDYIKKEMDYALSNDHMYDYLIVYTDLEHSAAVDFIVDEIKNMTYACADIIVCCKDLVW